MMSTGSSNPPSIYLRMPLSYCRTQWQSHQSCWQKWDSSAPCRLRTPPVCRQGYNQESGTLFSSRPQGSLQRHPRRFHSCFVVLTWYIALISILKPAAAVACSFSLLTMSFFLKANCGTFKIPRENSSRNQRSLSFFPSLSTAITNCTLKHAALELALCDVTKNSVCVEPRARQKAT